MMHAFFSTLVRLRVLGVAIVILIAVPVQASQLQITVTNDQPSGGFALAPVWFGLQNSSSYSPFTPGSTASSAIATLAQFGNTAPLTSLFSGKGPETTLTSGNQVKQFLPGQSNSTLINISNPSADQYLSYAGMVVPSNDFFMGNASALQIFNANGTFRGPMTIYVYGSNIWNSDTEAESITQGLTFIAGQHPGTGTQITNGTISTVLPNSEAFLNSINGLTTVANYTITNVPTSDQLVATIQVNSVPEPASIATLGIGMVGLLIGSRIVRGRKAAGTFNRSFQA